MADQSSVISWTTTKQKLTATSTCNAEYIALSAAVDETLYLQQLLKDIDLENVNYTPAHLFSDNDSSIKLAEYPVHHPKSKHINIRHHHIRDHLGTDIILNMYLEKIIWLILLQNLFPEICSRNVCTF